MKLLYITEEVNAVFHSQVVTLMNELLRDNSIEKIVLCIGVRDLNKIKTIEGLNKKVDVIFFKTFPMYPVFNQLTKKNLHNTISNIEDIQTFIIHTRIEFMGMLITDVLSGMGILNPKLLIDIRGAFIEEVLIYGKMNRFFKFLKLFGHKVRIRSILKKTKYINTVSQSLKDYIIRQYNITSENISCIPTISGDNFKFDSIKRKIKRKELGLNDDEILFVFSSGSSQKWQNVDIITQELISKGYKILLLTKDSYNHPNIINRFVDYKSVHEYLCAADIGILMRDDDVVNRVSSPIKFSEYACCGLPTISNGNIDMINQLNKFNEFGVKADLDLIGDDVIESLMAIDRKALSNKGINEFGILTIANKYIEIYKVLDY